MPHTCRISLVVAALLSLASGALIAQTSEDSATISSARADGRLPWPDQFQQGELTITVYPPQLERWQSNRLEGRAAVAVQAPGADKPVFGVVSLSAQTEIEGDTVVVRDVSASRASFPTASEHASSYLDAVRAHLAGLSWSTTRAQLESDLAIDRASQQARNQPLRNDPPRIVYVQQPTVLIPIDGNPVLRDMVGLGLQRVLNTRALVLFDPAGGRYFVFVADRWLQASTLDGPWTLAAVRPSALDDAKEQALAAGQVDLLDDADADAGRALNVMVSTTPAELVQTDGPPEYAPIDRTQLLYVTNSPNRLFLDLATQQYYVLAAGRWYRTRALQQGTWQYVAGGDLPRDFALIPSTHATEGVRASVPGTPQAQEAAIANSVPQVASVKRSAAKLDITYDGIPQFRPIDATSLEYAVNAPIPVIRVDWRSFYALDNGVWFFADSADGPWMPATSVPAVVYTIPRSSPLHYVTYVRVYEATPDTVYVGYTPGYVGSYLSTDATVVYGTGWYYRPWIGSVWYGPPVTWGFGFTYWNTWWNPWPVWYAPRVVWHPAPCYRPWWGPWQSARFAPRTSVVVGARVGAGAPLGPRPPGGVIVGDNFGPRGVTNIYRRWGPSGTTVNGFRGRPPGWAGGPGGNRWQGDRGGAPAVGVAPNPNVGVTAGAPSSAGGAARPGFGQRGMWPGSRRSNNANVVGAPPGSAAIPGPVVAPSGSSAVPNPNPGAVGQGRPGGGRDWRNEFQPNRPQWNGGQPPRRAGMPGAVVAPLGSSAAPPLQVGPRDRGIVPGAGQPGGGFARRDGPPGAGGGGGAPSFNRGGGDNRGGPQFQGGGPRVSDQRGGPPSRSAWRPGDTPKR